MNTLRNSRSFRFQYARTPYPTPLHESMAISTTWSNCLVDCSHGLDGARARRRPFAVCGQREAGVARNRKAQASAIDHQHRGIEARQRTIPVPQRRTHHEGAVVNATGRESQSQIRKFSDLARLLDARPSQIQPCFDLAASALETASHQLVTRRNRRSVPRFEAE